MSPTSYNPYAPHDVEEEAESGEQTSAVDEALSGTVDDALDWVGNDRVRAAAALEGEQAGKQRKTLVAALEELLEE